MKSGRKTPKFDDAAKRFGRRLRIERDAHGLTVAQLCRLAELSRYRIRRIESGADLPRLHELTLLSAALGKDSAELMRWTS